MNFTASFLPYVQTGYFSKMILDYINQDPLIQPYYQHPVSLDGVKASIAARKKFKTDRKLLVTVLQKQYAAVTPCESVSRNIELLLNENTFTICTAHQPNIFTGPLYFIYKILHVVKLAEQLKLQLPENDFVPVYYMGSEDADLDELGHVFIDGEKYEWKTSQTGAVGRMKVDKGLVKMLDEIEGLLTVHPFGAEIMGLLKECYKEGATIEQATFHLVNQLFADFGVLVLLPDNASLKSAFIPVIEKELMDEFSHTLVQETVISFPADYKVQASGRELNMFYLKDDRRDRIEMVNGDPIAIGWSSDSYRVVNTGLRFTKEEIISELNQHPERFSPNVILRPVFQEWILPNIAFIGGGGEVAYWLQLKKVFEAVQVPYPLLIVRNSFMFINDEVQALIDKLQFSNEALFQSELELINQLVKRDSRVQLNLDREQQELINFYEQLKIITGKIDITLQRHTATLQTQALKKIASLEKKMLRAEKRKFEAQQRQLKKIKARLFPNKNLQERIDNLVPYYAKWGMDFIRMIYEHSNGLEQGFGVLTPANKEAIFEQ